jgi:signal transduction histidine kinase
MSIEAGVLILVVCVLLVAAFLYFTKARYRELAKFSQQIDRVLHHTDNMVIQGFEEGELAILQSEITKMTLRIREQNDILEKDRQYLAEALADIAHQLRTPLTSANLILSLLVENPSEDARKAAIYEVEELLIQMDWLVTTLLKHSRLDAGVVVFQKEPVCLKEPLQSALLSLAIPLELRNIDVHMNVPEETTLQGDSRWLGEAFLNILKNCMEKCGENGVIAIESNENPLYIELTIRDSGAGFTQKDIAHVFDRFYRGENADSAGFGGIGFGIGMALSKKIITEQNGAITAKNHPDGGAVFSIRFQKTAS